MLGERTTTFPVVVVVARSPRLRTMFSARGCLLGPGSAHSAVRGLDSGDRLERAEGPSGGVGKGEGKVGVDCENGDVCLSWSGSGGSL